MVTELKKMSAFCMIVALTATMFLSSCGKDDETKEEAHLNVADVSVSFEAIGGIRIIAVETNTQDWTFGVTGGAGWLTSEKTSTGTGVILMARIALNMLNAGASGLSYWILMDLHYHKNFSYEGMQQLGLWRYKKEDYTPEPYFNTLQNDYEPRPQYYSYSLLTQFIRPESDIYPIDLKNEFAAGTAFKNKDGKWTYVFANGTASHLYIKLENKQGNADGEYAVYQYIQNRLPAGDGMIQPTENITVNGQKTEIIIQRQSVYVCQQK